MKRILSHAEMYVAGCLMAAMLVVLGLQIVTRYVFDDPLSWTEEVSRHLFIWMVFFGASGAIRDRSHVSVDLFVQMMPAPLRRAVGIAVDALSLFFVGNLFYWGLLASHRTWDLPTATLELPQGLVYAVFPVTAALMAIRITLRIVEDLRADRPMPEPEIPLAVRSVD